MEELTERQQKFVRALRGGALPDQAAIMAGYAKNNARAMAQRNLWHPKVLGVLMEQSDKSGQTADASKVICFFTRVLRGEEEAALRERMRAAEMLGRSLRLFDGQGAGDMPKVMVVDDL